MVAIAALIVGALVARFASVVAARRRASSYAAWLGRECVVTVGGRSYLATCVAVGWHGSVAVRGHLTKNRRTVWVNKHDVPRAVRWL